MPLSYHEPYERFKQWVRENRPKSVWDIGMGYGNIGTYAKEIISDIELNGVEIWLPYLVDKRSQAKNFKRIIVADIRDLINKLWSVDLVIAFDVIEHLERSNGVTVINYLKSITNMALLVALPIVDYPQGPLYNNEAERHLTQWKVNEMEELGGKTLFKGQICGLFEFKK